MVADGHYVTRMVEPQIASLFDDLPALAITGPRGSGKTTTARRYAATVVHLDHEGQAEPFLADPDAALASQVEPLLLDEWQAVPGVLGAVKRAVDADPRGRRFLLAGSVNAELTGQTWPGTGRVVPLRMYGLTERELAGRPSGELFLRRLAGAGGDPAAFPAARNPPDLRGYVELALRGGFPEPVLRLPAVAAQVWMEGYVAQVVTRDAGLLIEPRDPARLRSYFEALALNTAGFVAHRTLYEAAGINRRTAVAYDQLLTNLFVLDALPAWSSNRLARLVRVAKRYLVDPGIAAAALGLDVSAVMRDGNMLGRLIDTYAVAQLRPETQIGPRAPRLYHLRDRNGRREVDVVAELGGGDVVALEIKATASPKARDARHLEWLRDQLGERFRGGAVLHTGPMPFRLADRVLALPICSIWSG